MRGCQRYRRFLIGTCCPLLPGDEATSDVLQPMPLQPHGSALGRGSLSAVDEGPPASLVNVQQRHAIGDFAVRDLLSQSSTRCQPMTQQWREGWPGSGRDRPRRARLVCGSCGFNRPLRRGRHGRGRSRSQGALSFAVALRRRSRSRSSKRIGGGGLCHLRRAGPDLLAVAPPVRVATGIRTECPDC